MINELLALLRRDRLDVSQYSEGADPAIERIQRDWFNRGADHQLAVADRWAKEQAVHAGLAELRDAPVMDLTLKAAMTGGVE